ncbi:hypothetical protein NDU88_002611 [Pleurodeles waltl]|uniref:Uncharacterized protein n=1 Tax=Pleurodeles waltl TaxID=8319 RepID=A0AAV7UW51_PLEWA|nr:hypothetical protein NDU88_002611 [Pleurodeles waltl]
MIMQACEESHALMLLEPCKQHRRRISCPGCCSSRAKQHRLSPNCRPRRSVALTRIRNLESKRERREEAAGCRPNGPEGRWRCGG